MQAASRRRCLRWGLAAAAVAASGCNRQGGEDALGQLRQRGRLAVGYAVEPPFADLRADGQVDGESPTVARRVAEALGLTTINWIQTEFAHLIDDLLGTRFDLVAAGLFVTEERRRRVHFSRPTLRVREGWLARPGHPVLTMSYASARQRAGWRLVVLRGSLEERLLGEEPRAQIIAAPDARTAQSLVSSGAAEALALSLPTVRQMALRDPQRLVAAQTPASAGTGAAPIRLVALAMRPQDHSLHDAVDIALAGYLGSALHLQDLQRLGLGADDLPPPGAS